MNLDWRNIRTIGGSQREGFEKLCVQIADAEKPVNSKFVPTGSPDAGVECYAVLPDTSEWGWQAKYFQGPMEDAQWRQLDDSVKTALDKHPALVRYFVCAPLDLPDARISGRRSARQHWEQRVAKWEGWAQERGMSVEFIWWGDHELTNILSGTQHVGRRQFWFGQLGLNEEWFQQHLDEAVKAAGPRYTPEIHVDLPIARKLELFDRKEATLHEIKSFARDMRRRLSQISTPGREVGTACPVVPFDAINQSVNAVLNELAALKPLPVGEVPLTEIIRRADTALTAIDKAIEVLFYLYDEYDNEQRPQSSYNNPFAGITTDIQRIRSILHLIKSTASEADKFTNCSLILLKGSAGSGKTHLLCDWARRRIEGGAPTVLLMGQRFTEQGDPWQQALEHLDLSRVRAEEFVGALEAAAQVCGKRAILIIDAVNEGRGRDIWPSHLSAFLARIMTSPWIGVMISVRSTYVGAVIPEDVREVSVVVTHEGFTGHEYDALTTFFKYFGLELPSTPIIDPEFRNPLFLKTVCRGLQLQGEPRLPRGFRGITQTFDMYLDAVNRNLAVDLDYNPSDQLVKQALSRIAHAMHEAGDRWLSGLPRIEAENLVNGLLPGRMFNASLYRGLITEGLLYTDMLPRRQQPSEEVVRISYERFADHTMAAFLLDQHLDANDPSAAFNDGGELAFISDEGSHFGQGMLEAMSIQIPERTGKELIELASNLENQRGALTAFWQSIIWRRTDAFSEATTRMVGNLLSSEEEPGYSGLEALLTVAVIGDHALNAHFLDERLRREPLPDRDAWWSVYLYRAWSYEGSAIHRLIRWAWEISREAEPDDEVVELCAITLTWMLTTSHRFVRDGATKALVKLLTSRLTIAQHILERFSHVDDPYVAERIYAIAYGVAMRSRDSVGIGQLAQMAYDNVFASGTPPPHLLLRDYARGVVERAVYLGADLKVDMDKVRPPYRSDWPSIPNEESVQELIREMDGTDRDGDIASAGWRAIRSSVLGWDFARYIIGTNSSDRCRHWLSIDIDQDTWRPVRERREELLAQFSSEEQAALDAYESFGPQVITILRSAARSSMSIDDELSNVPSVFGHRDEAYRDFLAALSDEHRIAWKLLYEERPGFSLKEVQRYVLNRVVGLGWTADRFGPFDGHLHTAGNYGRTEHKSERIGKKYQWIAYHEILSYLADHFQFCQEWGDGGRYQGPWQIGRRDIDPSAAFTLPFGLEGESAGTESNWWAPTTFDHWNLDIPTHNWIMDNGDLPEMGVGLVVCNPVLPNVSWICCYSFQLFQEPHPPDQDQYNFERREVWFRRMACLVPKGMSDRFIDWVMSGEFSESNWQLSVPQLNASGVFLGEHGWSPASDQQAEERSGEPIEWRFPPSSDPYPAQLPVTTHSTSGNGYDCSVGVDAKQVCLPGRAIAEGCHMTWNGVGGDFVDRNSEVVAFDPSVHELGPGALLIRSDILEKYLSDHDLELCWAITGGKQAIGTFGQPYGWLQLQGAFAYRDGTLDGRTNAEYKQPSPNMPVSTD